MMLRLRLYAWRLGRYRKLAQREWNGSPVDEWQKGRALVYAKVSADLWALILSEPHAPYHVRSQLREMRRVWQAVAEGLTQPFCYDSATMLRRVGAVKAAKDVASKLRGF